MKVDQDVHKIWLHQAETCKYSVSLPVLSVECIRLWCDPGSLDRWKEIDPYSDLEDVGSGSDKTKDSVKPLSPNISPTVKYKLCIRKPTRQCSKRPLQAASVNIVYYNDSDDELPMKKHVPPKCIPSGGPSQSRIKLQKSRTTAPETTHPIPIKQKQKAETVSSPLPDSSDSNVPLSKIRDSLNKSMDSDVTLVNHDKNTSCKPTKKRVFVTRRVELRKYRRKRSYCCPVCKGKYETLGRLNEHYRNVHKSVKCSKYQMSFHTPSTLSRHMYTHHKPRKFCRCGAGFYFNSDLRIHKFTHRCIKSQFCQSQGCDKSYFSAADLAKHARTHLKINWKCQKCDYCTNDERLLKSHQRVHDRKIRYLCQKCNKGFIFHMQWA